MQNHPHGLSAKEDEGNLGRVAEFIRQLRANELEPHQVDLFLKHQNPFPADNVGADLDFVRAILGTEKVIDVTKFVIAWELAVPVPENIQMRYSRATIRKCAKENKKGTASWWLIYIHQWSLRYMRAMLGIGGIGKHKFTNETWWLGMEEDDWAKYLPEAGYYLLNLQRPTQLRSWKQQQELIFELGDKYGHCHEAIFTQAVITINMIVGNPFERDFIYRGGSLVYDRAQGSHVVIVCSRDQSGNSITISVRRTTPEQSIWGNVVVRKWDF